MVTTTIADNMTVHMSRNKTDIQGIIQAFRDSDKRLDELLEQLILPLCVEIPNRIEMAQALFSDHSLTFEQ